MDLGFPHSQYSHYNKQTETFFNNSLTVQTNNQCYHTIQFFQSFLSLIYIVIKKVKQVLHQRSISISLSEFNVTLNSKKIKNC